MLELGIVSPAKHYELTEHDFVAKVYPTLSENFSQKQNFGIITLSLIYYNHDSTGIKIITINN